jgi:hypothetical protein
MRTSIPLRSSHRSLLSLISSPPLPAHLHHLLPLSLLASIHPSLLPSFVLCIHVVRSVPAVGERVIPHLHARLSHFAVSVAVLTRSMLVLRSLISLPLIHRAYSARPRSTKPLAVHHSNLVSSSLTASTTSLPWANSSATSSSEPSLVVKATESLSRDQHDRHRPLRHPTRVQPAHHQPALTSCQQSRSGLATTATATINIT